MDELRIPYPDFKLGEVIDPEQHDLNNGYIQIKVNELVDFANLILVNGASEIPIVPPTDFTATNVKVLFDEIIARLKSVTVETSGAKFIGTPALNRITGTDVESQLKFINDLIQTAFVVSSLIADGAVVTSKIADNAITTTKIGANTVTFEKIADGSIITTKVMNNAITSDKLAGNSVSTNKIQDLAVTENKLGVGSVGTFNIKDQNVTGAKIANRSITGQKVALQTIFLENLAPEVLNVIPNSMLSARVVALEEDVGLLDSSISALTIKHNNLESEIDYAFANINTPNNLVALDSDGKVPTNLLPPITDVQDATLTEKGIVMLSNDINSDDETKAVTPKAVKDAMANTSSHIVPTLGGDPNTTDKALILTNHVNGPVNNVYFYIETVEYGGPFSRNLNQIARGYNRNTMYTRFKYWESANWSPWALVYSEASITASTASPSTNLPTGYIHQVYF